MISAMIPADTVLILLSSIPLLIRNMYLKKIFVCGYAVMVAKDFDLIQCKRLFSV
jgi:hypothetical protein